jgi:hypothetical protein
MEHRDNLYFEFDFRYPVIFNITDGTYITEEALSAAFANNTINPQEKMIFRLPQRFGLQNSRWIIGEEGNPPAVYNADRRMFVDLEVNMLRGAANDASYLPVILNPEWQYIGFQYFDRNTKNFGMVPQFLYLKGFNEAIDDEEAVTASTVYKDNCICLPWIEDRNLKDNRNRERIVLKFSTNQSFIESGSGLVNKTRDEVRAMTLRDRLNFYDLPEAWSSKNWYAKVGVGGAISPFVDIVNNESDPANPIVFDLDSIVLTDDDCEWESDWNSNNRFTVFDLKMKITKPDTNKTYLTDGTINSNFFPPEKTINESDGDYGYYPRLISLNGNFYDVTDKRSTGDLIGARAGVLNDEQVHYGDSIQTPITTVGNFELHYLTDCLDQSDNPVSALLIYWSCKFQPASGVTPADVENVHREGMINAKNRWEEKGYKFIPDSDPSGKNINVIPVFFYEAREDDPYKCTVHLETAGGRSNMGVSVAHFKVDDYQSYLPGAGDTDEDGNQYGWFTMAHELGHAIGLDDEYNESLEEDDRANVPDNTLWNPPLPKFDQYYPGMPYSCDRISMMNSNRAPRLRHFWYFTRWLNETSDVKELTGDTVFKVNHSGNNYNYILNRDYLNFYEPAYEDTGLENGEYGKYDLYLYKIGNDETTDRLIAGQNNFDGILVVRNKLQWFFEDHGGHTWANTNAKLMCMRDFQTRVDQHMNKKYYLECPADSEFKKVYIYFRPQYYFESSTTSDHFEITVKADGGGAIDIQPDYYDDDFDNDEFEVGASQDKINIYRYILGLSTYQGNPKQSINTITVNDLGFLTTRVGRMRRQTYELRG